MIVTFRKCRLATAPLALATAWLLSGCAADTAQSAMTSAGDGISSAFEGIIPSSLRSDSPSYSSQADLTATERRYVERFEKVEFNYNTVLEGALIGAGVGCGVGFLIGGDFEDCLKYGAGGAVVGGAAGAVVADANQKQANALVDAEKVLVATEEQNEILRQQNDDLRIIVADLKRDSAQIEAQRIANQISAEEAATQTAQIEARKRAVIDATRQAQAEYEANRGERNAFLAENRRVASLTSDATYNAQSDLAASDAAGQRTLVALSQTPSTGGTSQVAGARVQLDSTNTRQKSLMDSNDRYFNEMANQVEDLADDAPNWSA